MCTLVDTLMPAYLAISSWSRSIKQIPTASVLTYLRSPFFFLSFFFSWLCIECEEVAAVYVPRPYLVWYMSILNGGSVCSVLTTVTDLSYLGNT